MKKILTNLLLLMAVGTSGAWADPIETIGEFDASTGVYTGTYDVTVSNNYVLNSGETYHFSFVNFNNGPTAENYRNWSLCGKDGDTKLFGCRGDFWESVNNNQVGMNSDLFKDVTFAQFMNNMNGAVVNLDASLIDGTFTMNATITPKNSTKTFFYNYTKSITASSIKLYFTVDAAQVVLNKASKAVATIGTCEATTGEYTGTYDVTKSGNYTLNSGKGYHFNFVNYNSINAKGAYNQTTNPTGVGNWNNWVLGCTVESDPLFRLRNDNWEDVSNSSTGCTSAFDWKTFMTDMDGATVDMYVTFNNSTVTMKSTITTVANTTYTYSYTKGGVTASSVNLYFTVNASKIVLLTAEEVNTYTVTCDNATNGTVTANTAATFTGDEVTITATPNEGYVLDVLYVKDASDKAVTVTDNKFTMPASNVTVYAIFKDDTELVTNGTFDYNISGWTTDGTMTNESGTSQDGKFWWKDGWAENFADFDTWKLHYDAGCYIQQTVNELKAGYYTVKADLISNGGNKATFSVIDDQGNTLVSKTYVRDGWKNETYLVKLAADGSLTIKYAPEAGGSYWVAIDNVSLKATDAPETITVTPETNCDGYVSFYNADNAYTVNTLGTKIYKAAEPDDVSVTLTYDNDIHVIPAGQAVILRASDDGSIALTKGGSYEGDFFVGNKFTVSTGGTVNGYVMGYTASEGFGFYKFENATLAAGKVYIKTDNVQAAKLSIVLKEAVTAINNVNAAANANTVEGKFVKNGQLVIVKNGKQYNAAGAQVK